METESMSYEQHISRRGRVYLMDNANPAASTDNHVRPEHVMTYLNLFNRPDFVAVWKSHIAGELEGLALEAHLARLCRAGTRIPDELRPVKRKGEQLVGNQKLKDRRPFVWLKGLIACKLSEMQIGTKESWRSASPSSRFSV
jgi:hypothetical protein